MEHKCEHIPEHYCVFKQYEDEWVARDNTYRFLDKVKYCPFCGEKLS